jgi:ubiquinone/menaquinone biosynthesis C-methylase UbiE
MTNDWRSYDRIAASYEALWTPRFVTVARHLLHLVPPREESRVLDLGAGTGAVARALGQVLPTLGRMVGCDLSFGMLSQARLPPPFRAVVGNMLRLPLREAAFDLVTANCVLSHVEDHQTVLREVLRVLDRPGALLASNWLPPGEDPATAAWGQLLDAAVGPGTAERASTAVSPLETFFSVPENIRASLAGAGFDAVRIDEIGYSSEHTVEEYVAERSLNAPGRLARQMLGESGWRAFSDRATAEFRRRFGDRIGFSRRVLLAAATVR